MKDAAAIAQWAADVLAFWFDEIGEPGWFRAGPALDAEIDTRFRELHDRLAAGIVSPRRDCALEVLAAVLVFDQFSRHLYRGTPLAYAWDDRARELTRHVLAAGLDRDFSAAQRLFAYMPLQHSEDRADQSDAVRLFAEIGNAEWTSFAVAHRDVIERFGRFPHRNDVLGRVSTPEERQAIVDGAAW